MTGAPHPGASPLLAYAGVRVTGVLQADAQLAPTLGAEPHALLMLQLANARGLPFTARIDLGTDVAIHMLAQAELPRMRVGALVSVAGDGLELRADHSHAVLRVVGARDAVIFAGPRATPSTDTRNALEG